MFTDKAVANGTGRGDARFLSPAGAGRLDACCLIRCMYLSESGVSSVAADPLLKGNFLQQMDPVLSLVFV